MSIPIEDMFRMRALLREISVLQQKKKMPRRSRTNKPAAVSATKPPQQNATTPRHKNQKKAISTALREQVWLQHQGRVFEAKCLTPWCKNTISVFDFQCGHDTPESRGGATDITNLYPICGRCNLSMGNRYTFQEWAVLSPVAAAAVVVVPDVVPPTCFSRFRQWLFGKN